MLRFWNAQKCNLLLLLSSPQSDLKLLTSTKLTHAKVKSFYKWLDKEQYNNRNNNDGSFYKKHSVPDEVLKKEKEKKRERVSLASFVLSPFWTNNRELTQPRRRRQQKPNKFAYLIVKSNSFARFARAVFIFDISQTFSFFLRREITCFAVVWTKWAYDDKCSILSSYLWSAGCNLIPG